MIQHIVATSADSVVRCSDCLSSVVMVAHAPDVWTIQVQHSLTCPAWTHPRAEVVGTFVANPEAEERSNADYSAPTDDEADQ